MSDEKQKSDQDKNDIQIEEDLFYEKTKLDSKLSCPYCMLKYKDPRFLPCHHSACFDCIKNRLDKNQIDCKICNKTCEIQINDLAVNILILELLNIEPTRVERGTDFDKLHKETKKIVKLMSQLVQKSKNLLNGYEKSITDRFELIRNKIDLATEIRIEELNNHRENLLNEVKECEKAYLEDENLNKKEELTILTDKCGENIKKWNDELLQPKTTEKDIKEIKSKVETVISELSERISLHEKLLLFEGKCIFNESNIELNSDTIGVWYPDYTMSRFNFRKSYSNSWQ